MHEGPRAYAGAISCGPFGANLAILSHIVKGHSLYLAAGVCGRGWVTIAISATIIVITYNSISDSIASNNRKIRSTSHSKKSSNNVHNTVRIPVFLIIIIILRIELFSGHATSLYRV